MAIALLGCSSLFVTNPQPTASSSELRGVWLTNIGSGVLFSPGGIQRAMQQLSTLNFNTVYPVVWNRGYTIYPSAVAKRVTGSAWDPLLELLRLRQDVLAEIIKQGNQYGLRVIPWFEYGFMTPANSQLARRHPDWLTNRRDGSKILQQSWNQFELVDRPEPKPQSWWQKLPEFLRQQLVSNQVWLNPLHPQVQKFILDLILEVVTKYDVAGIQLDDHFGLPIEFGYDSFTIQLYQQEHGDRIPPNDPKNAEWMRWRASKISDFMQRIYQAVKAVKPDCLISLSPNSQDFAYRAYLQDWRTWVQQGWVEELICQIYRDDMKSFLTQLEQPALQIARRQIPTSIGILSGSWRRPIAIEKIQQQVQAVRSRGFHGVSFFYWESLWGYIAPESPSERRAGFQQLFPFPAKP